MGIGRGLKKDDREKTEISAADFIAGSEKRVKEHNKAKPKTRVFERYTFSLTPDVSKDIDKLSLTPNDFKVSRSDVIKAGIEALKEMNKNELIERLRKVK